MSITPVAVDSVVWFSLADRAGAIDSSIRVSDRSFSSWVVEPVFASYESASDFARRASGVAGVGVVVRRCPAVVYGSVTHEQPWSCLVSLFASGNPTGASRCSVPCAAPVGSYRLVQLHGAVGR